MSRLIRFDRLLERVLDACRRGLVVILCGLIGSMGLPRALAAETNIDVIGVVQGDVSFGDTPGCTNCTIHQSTQDAIVHLGDLQLSAEHTLQISQPNAQARLLGRIMSANPSFIDGTVTAPGTVIFVNPAGVMFGSNAVLDVGQLFAAAGNISDADFLAGDARFTELSGSVVNEGSIHANAVSLIGKYVANHGEIYVENGAIAMVAGGEAYIGQVGGHVLIHLSGDAGVSEHSAAVENTGVLDAGVSGRVGLAAGDVLGALSIDHRGTTRAGKIEIDAGNGGVGISGTLSAADYSEGGHGGEIDVYGGLIGVFDAQIDASGDAGGGRVRIGGDFHGEGEAPSADNVFFGENTSIAVDAVSEGDGGEAVVWSDGFTSFRGSVSARGGLGAGDGGFIEVSGKQHLDFKGSADTRAPNGDMGTLLLDPETIRVVPGEFDGSDEGSDRFAFHGTDDLFHGYNRAPIGTVLAEHLYPDLITESEIEGIAATTNIRIEATDDITFFDFWDNEVNLQTTGNVTFVADADHSGEGDFVMLDPADKIITEGADLEIYGANIFVGAIDTRGASGTASGNVSLLASDNLSALGSIHTGGGDLLASGSTVHVYDLLDSRGGSGGDLGFQADQLFLHDSELQAGRDLDAWNVGSVFMDGAGTHVLTSGRDLRLGSVHDSGAASSMDLRAKGSIELDTVDIDGALTLRLDTDRNSAETLTAGELRAGSIHVEGGDGGLDDVAHLTGELRSTSGSIELRDLGHIEMDGGVNVLSADRFDVLGSVGEMRLTGSGSDQNRWVAPGGVDVDAEIVTSAGLGLEIAASAGHDIELRGVDGVGTLTLQDARRATVTGMTDAHLLRAERIGEELSLGEVELQTLDSGGGDHHVALRGGGIIRDRSVFTNTGGVTLGDDAGDSLTFIDGVDTTRTTTRGAGTVSTGNETIELGDLELDGDLTLSSGSADIVLEGTVNGPHELTLLSRATTHIRGVVGGARKLAGLVTDALGNTLLGGDVTTEGGDSRFGDAVTLTDTVTVADTGAGTITFEGRVDGAHDLITAGNGHTRFESAVGSGSPDGLGSGAGASLRLHSQGTTRFESTVNTAGGIVQNNGGGQLYFGDDVHTRGTSQLNADVELHDMTFHTDGVLVVGSDAADTLTLSGGSVRIEGDESASQLLVRSVVEGSANLVLDMKTSAVFLADVGRSASDRIGSGTGAAVRILSEGITNFAGKVFSASGIVQDDAAGQVSFGADVDIAAGDTASHFDGDVALGDLTLASEAALSLGNELADRVTLTGSATRVESEGDLVFAGQIDGPAVLTVSSPTRVELAGDVGANVPLLALHVETPGEIELGGEVVRADDEIALNPTGRTVISPLATIYKRAGSLLLEAARVITGRGEKLTVGGDLTISASESATLSDLTAAGTLRVDSPEIRLQAREPGPVQTASGSLIGDAGVDYVANAIHFSSVPQLDGPGTASFVTPSGGEISSTLNGFANRAHTVAGPDALTAEGLSAGTGMLDGAALGPERTNPAGADSSLKRAPTLVLDDPALTDDLSTRWADEIVGFLRGSTPQPSAQASRLTSSHTAAIARALYADLFAEKGTDAARALLQQALESHLAAGGAWPVDAQQLLQYIRQDRRQFRAMELVNQLGGLLDAVRYMGLTETQFELVRVMLIAEVTPDGVAADDLAQTL